MRHRLWPIRFVSIYGVRVSQAGPARHGEGFTGPAPACGQTAYNPDMGMPGHGRRTGTGEQSPKKVAKPVPLERAELKPVGAAFFQRGTKVRPAKLCARLVVRRRARLDEMRVAHVKNLPVVMSDSDQSSVLIRSWFGADEIVSAA